MCASATSTAARSTSIGGWTRPGTSSSSSSTSPPATPRTSPYPPGTTCTSSPAHHPARHPAARQTTDLSRSIPLCGTTIECSAPRRPPTSPPSTHHCADAGTSPRRADHGGVGVRAANVAVAVAVQAYSTGCQERLAGGADRTEFRVVPVLPAGGRATGRGNRAGNAWAPTTVAAELFRLDGLGVLVAGAVRRAAAGHRSSAPPWCVPTVAGTVWRAVGGSFVTVSVVAVVAGR